MDEREATLSIAGAVVLCVGCALLAISVGFLTFALTEWMRVGAWPDYPVSRLLAELAIPYPRVAWAGGQGAIDWLLSLGVCTVFFWGGVIVAALGGWMMVAHDKRQKVEQISA